LTPEYIRSLIVREESLIYAALVVIFILLVAMSYSIYLSHERRSFVYIDLTTDTGACAICYARVPNADRNYAVRVQASATRVKLHDYCLFGVVEFETRPWKLENTRTNQSTTLARSFLVGDRDMKKVKSQLSAPSCVITPVIVYTHEYIRKHKILPPARSDSPVAVVRRQGANETPGLMITDI